MAGIKVPTNFNIDLEFEVPEFYRRLIALLIDVLLQYFYLRIASEIYRSIEGGMKYNTDNQYNLYWLQLIFLMPVMVYHFVLEVTTNGQSIGKKVMGLRVVDENGGKPSISQFAIRWLLRISDVWIAIILLTIAFDPTFGENVGKIIMVFAALGFLITDISLIVSSRKGQRIGDILAKTILIRTNTKGSIEDTVFVEVADNYVPSFPQIMQLSDRDINAIKSILETARKKGDVNMAEAAGAKIKAHLGIQSEMSPFDFLDVLLKDYNYLSTR